MSSAPSANKCEICNLQATAGIIDSDNIHVRYTCQDHYMALYDKIAKEARSNNDKQR